jgi:hypothetical protein
MSQLIKTCLAIVEIDSEYPTTTETGSCDCGYYTGKVNNCFFDFDHVEDELPAGCHIDSAYLKVAQVSGGYIHQQNIDITLRSGSWGAFTWNSQPADTGAGTLARTLTGSSAGTRSFDVTTLLQWIVDNTDVSHIFKLARNPNTTTGSLDAKRFSTTAGNHTLEINYTEAPTAPTIGTATRVSDTQATIAWTNNPAATGPYASLVVWRSTDAGTHVQLATLAGTATSYTDTTTTANHRYDYIIVAVNSAGSTQSGVSNVIYMTPAAPTMGTATKTGETTVTLTWTDNANSEQYFEVERRVDAGAWSSLSAVVPQDSESYEDSSLPAGSVEYRVRALRGALVSAWSAVSNAVEASTPPAAPTITSDWGTYEERAATLRVAWTHNSLDGSLQSDADVYWEFDDADDSDTVGDDTAYYDIDTSGEAVGTVVEAKVRTYGLDVDPGEYSEMVSATLADAPEIAITTPATDETVVADLPLVAAWDYVDALSLDQAYWRLQLYRGATLVNTWTGTTEQEQSISSTYLEDGQSYTLVLLSRSGSGLETTVERDFTTDFLAPEPPAVEAIFDRDELSSAVIAEVGVVPFETLDTSLDLTTEVVWFWFTWQYRYQPATDHLELQRLDAFDGTTDTEELTDDLTAGSVYTDYLPRLDQIVTYRVLAVAANGAYSYTDAEVITKSRGAAAFNSGDGYADLFKLRWNRTDGHQSSDDSEKYQFEGRALPVVYEGEHVLEPVHCSGVIFTDADKTALRTLRAWMAALYYREPDGYRARVKVDGLSHTRGQVVGSREVSVDMTVVE